MKSDKPSAKKKVVSAAGEAADAPARPRRTRKQTEAAPESPVSAAPQPLEAAPAPAPKRKAPAMKKALTVPPILLEGDKPAAPPVAGPGQRYALGPSAPAAHGAVEETGELPESYGTRQLFLAARDPHWLYARWDFTREQQKSYNTLSADRHLVLRIFIDEIKGEPTSTVHVHPESTHWFVHVNQAGKKYLAEIGYYLASGKWITISQSTATMAPPDAMSEDTSAIFATIPVEIPFTQLLELAQTAVRRNVPFTEIVRELRAHGHDTPRSAESRWTPAQERALASIISMDRVRRVWMGSLEITELIRRQMLGEISSMAAAELSRPTSPIGAISSVSSLSSPFGGRERQKGFWFMVNAELIIYGATEPNAQVTIGGRVIKLRPDGSFSYRFALPDGQYELPAVAVSNDKTDARAAELKFSRGTDYHGEVGTHPQDPQLKPPLAEHVA